MKLRLSSSRHGAVLVAVLVCLLVVMLISASLARGLVFRQRQARSEPQRVQAFWFAESALQRGMIKARSSRDYSGEVWEVVLQQNGIEQRGVAVIRVDALENESHKRSVIVEARWPDDPVNRILEQRQLVIDTTDTGASS